jgi:hypothetical protein
MLVLFPNTDMLFEVRALKRQNDGVVVNTASVNMTLLDALGATVAGQTWPAVLAAAGQDGHYAGVLVDTLDLSPGRGYLLLVVADAGENMKHTWKIPCRVAHDDGD